MTDDTIKVLQEIQTEIDKELLDYVTFIENVGDTARQSRTAWGIVRNIINNHLESTNK